MSAYDRPSFGIILSLLTIGLVLNGLSTFNSLAQLFLRKGAIEGNVDLLVVETISFIWVLTCLGMLLARRSIFIPLFAGLLLFTLASNAYFFYFGGTDVEPQLAMIVMGVQALIAALWLAYLALSQHLREVCCD